MMRIKAGHPKHVAFAGGLDAVRERFMTLPGRQTGGRRTMISNRPTELKGWAEAAGYGFQILSLP